MPNRKKQDILHHSQSELYLKGSDFLEMDCVLSDIYHLFFLPTPSDMLYNYTTLRCDTDEVLDSCDGCRQKWSGLWQEGE